MRVEQGVKMSNLNTLRDICHKAASNWWIDQRTGQDLRIPNEDGSLKFNVPEKLCLIHSEISEAMNIDRAVKEKLAYNAQRADHKPENRLKCNGKRF